MMNSTLNIIDSGSFSDKGPYRHRNEDIAHTSTADGIFIVADGLGGAAAGDQAARMATDLMCFGLLNDLEPATAIVEALPESQVRDAICERINHDIDISQAAGRTGFAFLLAHYGVLLEGSRSGSVGMAAALVAASYRDGVMNIGHVGDCRAYTWSKSELSLLTRDHSLSMALAGRKAIPKGAENSPYLRSRLTQVVGGEVAPTPDIVDWSPQEGDQLLLCSDGVWGELSEHNIVQILTLKATATEISQSLVEAAIANGSKDNATALVVRF